MTRTPDAPIPEPDRSAAVLVGGYEYPYMPGLPSARTSVTELAEVLADPLIWGLKRNRRLEQENRCRVVVDPDRPTEIISEVVAAGALASDMLLFYFSGHGLVDHNELYLALRETQFGKPYTALAYRHLRDVILAAGARRMVVVLDCCYSGNVLGTLSDRDSVIADGVGVTGACVITATAEFQRALAPSDERFTAFSGEFIRVLRQGDPGPREFLDLNSVYAMVCHGLAERGIQVTPQIRDRNAIGRLPFVKNAAHGGAAVTAPARDTTSVRPPQRPARTHRKIAARPFEFAGRLYSDPHLLVQAMSTNWDTALPLVDGVEAIGFDRWLHNDVRDLDLPANFMQTGTPDERIARLLAHYAPDTIPVFRGYPVDVTGLAKLCRATLSGDSDSTALLAAMTNGLLAWFAAHECPAKHPGCSASTGCQVLKNLPANTALAVTAVANDINTWRDQVEYDLGQHTYAFLAAVHNRCPSPLHECLTAAVLTDKPNLLASDMPTHGADVRWQEGSRTRDKVTLAPDIRIIYDTGGMATRLRARILLGVLIDNPRLWDDELAALPPEPRSPWWQSLATAPRPTDPLHWLVLTSFLVESAAVAAAEAAGPPPELRTHTPEWKEIVRRRSIRQRGLDRAWQRQTNPPPPSPPLSSNTWNWVAVAVFVLLLLCLCTSCLDNRN